MGQSPMTLAMISESPASMSRKESEEYVFHLFQNADEWSMYCNRWHLFIDDLADLYINRLACVSFPSGNVYTAERPAHVIRTEECEGCIWTNGAVLIFEDDTLCVWIDQKTRKIFKVPPPKDFTYRALVAQSDRATLS